MKSESVFHGLYAIQAKLIVDRWVVNDVRLIEHLKLLHILVRLHVRTREIPHVERAEDVGAEETRTRPVRIVHT